MHPRLSARGGEPERLEGHHRPLRELVAETGELSDDQLDAALDALALTRGGVPESS